MKVLVTGAGGMLGNELITTFSDHEVIAARHDEVDVSDRAGVLGVITNLVPDLVLHCAAFTAVDDCEDQPDRAYAVNTLGTRNVADAARRVGAHLCYVSTDYVFDGTKEGPYLEWDTPNPISVYGRSKFGGELELEAAATVVRTSWVCGAAERNFVSLVLRLARSSPELAFVDDQKSCPTIASDLATTIRTLAVERRPGVFHVTNQGTATRFDLANAIIGAAALGDIRIRPIPATDLDPPQRAPRPVNSVLDNAALRCSGIPLLPDYRDSIARLVRELTT